MGVAGTGLLWLVLTSAAGSAVLWWLAPRMRRPALALANMLGLVAAAGAVVAMGLMMAALIQRDQSLAYAQRAVEPGMPLYYRVTSLWAGTEGSLLLWLVATAGVAAVFGATVVRRLDNRTMTIAAGVVQVTVVAAAVVTLVAHPFAPGEPGAFERPSPLLQDHPAMGVHPPLLYAGFTLLAVPYALAIAAALTRAWEPSWWSTVHRWTVVAWVPLTLGIALGAWWSYAVLGWGGYWAWDPVENASLLPWFAATALLHTVGHSTRRPGTQRWVLLFALLSYILVLLATFLTRSGVVASIHTFAVSPLGPVLLGCTTLAGAAAIVAMLKRPSLPAPRRPRRHDAALVTHRWGVLAISAIVLAGTVLPAVIEAVAGSRVAVGPPWYERVLAPFGLILLVALAAGPWLQRSRSGQRQGSQGIGPMRLGLATSAVAAGVVAVPTALITRDVGLTVTGSLAGFVIVGTVARMLAGTMKGRSAIGAAISHIGVAVGAVALVASSGAHITEQSVQVGESVEANGTVAVLVSVEDIVEERRTIERARVVLAGAGAEELRPELRWYHEHDVVLAGPGIHSGLWSDVYVTLLGTDPAAGSATLRLAINPMVPWLWASVFLLVGGVSVAGAPSVTTRAGSSQDRGQVSA